MIAASLVVLALLAGIAGTTWGLIREANRVTERDGALKQAADRAEERDLAFKTANDRADDLKYRLGVSQMVQARIAYEAGEVVTAAEWLNDVPPGQRGWEWRYMKQQTRGGLFTLYGHIGTVTSVSFSPDGSRIVTGSVDGTAQVWDARTGAALLDFPVHKGARSASFSPDGSRILTVWLDWRMEIWDARTGAAALKLKGDTGAVVTASFSPDGSRILTGSQDRPTAKVWDARTGQELEGERLPPETPSSPISPDGRSIAHAVGNRVELIALNPDAQELDYRRSLTRPDPVRYRREYDEAKKIGDEFAARFYLGLLPTRSRADAIISPLFASLLIREDVIAALRAQPADDPQVQAACLKMAGTWPESAEECNNAGWALVLAPGLPDTSYQRGLRLANAARRLDPENGTFLNTLGVGQYRCGLIAEALATLTRSNALNHEKEPSDLAFLALAQHRLGQTEKARETLARLRAVMKDPQQAGNPEAQAFLREAETIELDRVFPADPFAP